MAQCITDDQLNSIMKKVIDTTSEGVDERTGSALKKKVKEVSGKKEPDAASDSNKNKGDVRGDDLKIRAKEPFVETIIEGQENLVRNESLNRDRVIEDEELKVYESYRLVNRDGTCLFPDRTVNVGQCKIISKEIIDDFSGNEINLYNNKLKYLDNNINVYTSLHKYQSYLGGIINERLDFLERIKNKINTYKQNNFTDNRKNSYLASNLEFYKNIHFYIFILYYAIFIAFLIFSNFIKDKLYENKYVMIYVVVILIIPFILRYILLNIYNLYISYIERNYLKLDEISYKYIVEETDHKI